MQFEPYPVWFVEDLYLLGAGQILSVRPGSPEHFGVLTPRLTVISASKLHGEVVEESLEDFAGNGVIYVHGYWGALDPDQVMELAYSQIGEPYRLFNNNCEHFVRFCHGLQRKSPQLDRAIGIGLTLAVVCVVASTMENKGAPPTINWI